MSIASQNNLKTNHSSVLLSLKPRQVVLAQINSITNTTTTLITTHNNNSNSNSNRMVKKNNDDKETTSLTNEQNSLLLNSVLCYLNDKQFYKPFKHLLSAAQIQDDSWKACALNLEDIFKAYMEKCAQFHATLGRSSDKELLANGTKKDGDGHSSEEAVVKKKKKKGNDCVNLAAVAEDVESKTKKKTKRASDSVEETKQVTEQATKEKDKKKKSKHESEPPKSNGEADPDAEGKSKDKKKKKKQSSDSGVEKTDNPVEKETALSGDMKKVKEDLASEMLSNGDTEVANKEGNQKEKKESKKRKRSDFDENVGSTEPKTVTAFQRVKIDDVEFADDRLQDNSYWAKDGADVGYGARAQEVLGQVRGRDFRHEKTKKKRGSYRGGLIDLHSHSVKFNYEDEEE